MPAPDQTLLCLDLASQLGTVAVVRNGETLAEAIVSDEGRHSEKLIASLSRVLELARTELSSVTSFVTTSGPGSFTGLRIAYASLKALAMSGNKPLESLSGAEARAITFRDERGGEHAKLTVLSQVSSERCLVSTFDDGKLVSQGLEVIAEVRPPDEGLLLVDDRLPPIHGAIRWGSRANHLGRALDKALSRRSFSTPSERINATPEYFGVTRY